MSFFTRKRILIIIGLLVVVGLIFYFVGRGSGTKYQFVTVTSGTIKEIVSVTGNTTPVQSLDLGFQNGGTIAAVNKDVGTHVGAGEVIAREDTSDLQAQLAQAQANVDAQTAQLASLKAGAQPADIQASQAALAKGQQDLANMYANVASTLSDSYSKANDAVRNQLTSFFSNPESSNPQLTFTVSDSQVMNNAQSERITVSVELNGWQSELNALNAGSSSSTPDSALASAAAHLLKIKKFLADVSTAVVDATGLSPTTVASYKTNITAAQTEVNTATTNINTLSQNIASQKLTVAQLQAQLNLKLAGSTAEQIASQQAQVEQAQASAQQIQVKIAQASLTSPISGVISVQNAKVGQVATPGATVTSIISDTGLEVDAFVPETDIGKVAVGNPVSMTLDAFQGETFTGKVFYIDPAQTVVSGVVDYKIKISFDTPDSRLKSGLTANLNIEAQSKDNVLILPQFAILQNDQGTFVEVLENGAPVNKPVTLGIRDTSGNVEVTSGVTDGEQVLNIGLKSGS